MDRPQPVVSKEDLERISDRVDFEWDMRKQDPTRPSITAISAVPKRNVRPMSTVFSPLIDPKSSQVEQGFYCTSCLYTTYDQDLFTRDSFLDHLKDCRVRPFEISWNTFYGSLKLDFEGSGCD
jgi:hypothetical protein